MTLLQVRRDVSEIRYVELVFVNDVLQVNIIATRSRHWGGGGVGCIIYCMEHCARKIHLL